MAKVHGKGQYLKIGTSVASGSSSSIDWEDSGAVSDTTSMGDDSETGIPGIGSGSFTATGWYDDGTADALLAMANTQQTVEYGPEGNASGKPKLSAPFLITSVRTGGSVRDTMALTITGTRVGDVTTGTFTV